MNCGDCVARYLYFSDLVFSLEHFKVADQCCSILKLNFLATNSLAKSLTL